MSTSRWPEQLRWLTQQLTDAGGLTAPRKASTRKHLRFMVMSTPPHTVALSLYRGILRAHRSLPSHLRNVGDAYVKSEFRLHRTAREPFVAAFLHEWSVYLSTLRTQAGENVGEHLPESAARSLTTEQKEQLNKLKAEAAQVWRDQ